MSTYKLTYFNVKGRAESSRMLFALGGVKYEDTRLEGSDGNDWKAMKPNTLFGQLPMLEVDGVTIAQSRAIERLIAKRTGVYGKDDIEQAKSDMIVDSVEDVYKAMTKIFGVPEDERPALMKKIADETLPSFFPNVEKQINKDGFLISSKVMWADIAIFVALENLVNFGAETAGHLDKVPKLKALRDKVAANPKIAKWIAERPITKM